MALLQNRLHWLVIALVGATLTWNLSVPHLRTVTARAQEPRHYPFSNGDTVSLGFIPDGVVTSFTFNQPPKLETWYNLATVKYIDRIMGTR